MTIAFISHPDCTRHDMGDAHPESPQRLHAISDQLISSRLDVLMETLDAPLATREQLCLAHETSYVDQIFKLSPQQGTAHLDPDTSMNPQSLNAALRAAGAVIYGVDRVMSGLNHAAFCSIRPPGHHALHDRAMGFCIFNNIAIGATHALQQYGLKRVAIVDFDVHHGNGTEDIFQGNPSVMLCSTFQHPFYPYSGVHTQADNIVNVPLAAGTDGKLFRTAIETHILPALESFQPELLMISAGFDGHIEDPLADFRLTETDYAWITTQIRHIADKYANGRIVSTLEGGYALSALGRSVAAHLHALL
jgi:acetoin utilization deacetylase AcuC-like enzyme